MAHVRITIDRTRPLREEPGTGHNRWHPAIPAIATAGSGDTIELEARDSQDGQIAAATTIADLAHLRQHVAHPLTGPIAVEGAEPGDLLAVDILDVATEPSAFTVFGHRYYALLRDDVKGPFVVHWRIAGGFATSADIPGVRIPGAPFMGTMGTAPSVAMLEEWNRREAELAARGGLVALPTTVGAVPEDPAIAAVAARTVPPRENGGNQDVRQLVAGTTLFLPVWLAGANFSAGDGHFAQGDGESCGTAIETGTTLLARLRLLKGEAARRRQRFATFECRTASPRTIRSAPYFATTGTAVRADGFNANEDLWLAARNALLAMIDHLGDRYGYSAEQAYALCSVAVDLHVSQIVNHPNVTVSAFLPLDIFA